MNKPAGYRSIDLVAVTVANLVNLILIPVFVLRSMRVERFQIAGYIWVVFILILLAVVVLNARAKREWWAIALGFFLEGVRACFFQAL